MSFTETFKADYTAFEAVLNHVFATAKTEVSALLHDTASVISEAVKERAPQIEGDLVSFLKTSALAAVAAASAAPGNGAAKMEAALAAFVAAISTKALPLLVNEMRTLIETALLLFKSKLALPAPAPVAK